MRFEPEFSVKNYVKAQPFKAPERKEWMRDLLLKAGLPEWCRLVRNSFAAQAKGSIDNAHYLPEISLISLATMVRR